MSRPRVFTVLDFNQVHMPRVHIQLVGLPHAVGCRGPLCGVVSASQCMMSGYRPQCFRSAALVCGYSNVPLPYLG
eukprot:1158485-Pelagomonas_calceolata.AAC.1